MSLEKQAKEYLNEFPDLKNHLEENLLRATVVQIMASFAKQCINTKE